MAWLFERQDFIRWGFIHSTIEFRVTLPGTNFQFFQVSLKVHVQKRSFRAYYLAAEENQWDQWLTYIDRSVCYSRKSKLDAREEHCGKISTISNDEAVNENEKYEFAFTGSFSDDCNSYHLEIVFELSRDFNPLSPGVKLQILLLCFHTFLTEVVGRSC